MRLGICFGGPGLRGGGLGARPLGSNLVGPRLFRARALCRCLLGGRFLGSCLLRSFLLCAGSFGTFLLGAQRRLSCLLLAGPGGFRLAGGGLGNRLTRRLHLLGDSRMLQAALFQHVEHVRGRTLPESPARDSQHLRNAPLQRQRLGGLADSFELRVEARVLQSGALEDLDPPLMSLLGHLSACGLNQPVDVSLDRCANALAHVERLGVLGIEGQGFVGGGRCRAEGAGIELLPRAVERRGNALGPFAQTAPLGLEPLVLGTDLLQQLVEPRLGLRRVCQRLEHAECLVDAAGRERVACARHLLEAPLPFLCGPPLGLLGSPRLQYLLDLGAQRQGRCKRVIKSEHGVDVRARCFEDRAGRALRWLAPGGGQAPLPVGGARSRRPSACRLPR